LPPWSDAIPARATVGALQWAQRGAAGFEDFANEPGAWVRVAGDGGVRPGVARFDQPYAESALLTPCDDAISAFAPDGIARHRIDRRPDLYAALRGP
jgi:hypothetical protein